jgi:hypothetical protein
MEWFRLFLSSREFDRPDPRETVASVLRQVTRAPLLLPFSVCTSVDKNINIIVDNDVDET